MTPVPRIPRPRDTDDLASHPHPPAPRPSHYPPHTFLGGLAAEDLQDLWQHLHIVRLPWGGALDVTPSRVLYLVIDGVVRETPGTDDRPADSHLRRAGDVIESATVFEAHGNAVTLHGTRSTLLGALPRTVFHRLLADQPPLLTSLARSTTSHAQHAASSCPVCCRPAIARMTHAGLLHGGMRDNIKGCQGGAVGGERHPPTAADAFLPGHRSHCCEA